MREGKELKAPRHASATATRDGNLPLHDGSLPYVTATYLIPDTYIAIIVSLGNTNTYILHFLYF